MLLRLKAMSKDELSTKEVWELLSARLSGFILSRVADEHAASDLLQETFLRIHKNLSTLDNKQRVVSWVFQIARNLITDYYRSKSQAEDGTTTEPQTDRSESENMNEHIAGCTTALLTHLPDTYREAVRLYEIEQLPQQEIAGRLGISLSGAKSRVQRGRDKLKQLLHNCCAFEHDSRGNILDYQRKSEDKGCDACGDSQSECM